jgi:hypothetical protein
VLVVQVLAVQVQLLVQVTQRRLTRLQVVVAHEVRQVQVVLVVQESFIFAAVLKVMLLQQPKVMELQQEQVLQHQLRLMV